MSHLYVLLFFLIPILKVDARCSNPGGLLQSVAFPTKCLHIKAPASNALGLRLDLAECSTYSLDQLWNVEDMANYGSAPGPISATLNNQVISIDEDSNGDEGGGVALYPDNSQPNQQFAIIAGDYNSQFLLQVVSSKKCLTVQGQGGFIDQTHCAHSAAQQFKIVQYGTHAV